MVTWCRQAALSQTLDRQTRGWCLPLICILLPNKSGEGRGGIWTVDHICGIADRDQTNFFSPLSNYQPSTPAQKIWSELGPPNCAACSQCSTSLHIKVRGNTDVHAVATKCVRPLMMTFTTVAAENGSTPLKKVLSSSRGTISVHSGAFY